MSPGIAFAAVSDHLRAEFGELGYLNLYNYYWVGWVVAVVVVEWWLVLWRKELSCNCHFVVAVLKELDAVQPSGATSLVAVIVAAGSLELLLV